jgi:hypothetical protein
LCATCKGETVYAYLESFLGLVLGAILESKLGFV